MKRTKSAPWARYSDRAANLWLRAVDVVRKAGTSATAAARALQRAKRLIERADHQAVKATALYRNRKANS